MSHHCCGCLTSHLCLLFLAWQFMPSSVQNWTQVHQCHALHALEICLLVSSSVHCNKLHRTTSPVTGFFSETKNFQKSFCHCLGPCFGFSQSIELSGEFFSKSIVVKTLAHADFNFSGLGEKNLVFFRFHSVKIPAFQWHDVQLLWK